jgi:hypothetical protein
MSHLRKHLANCARKSLSAVMIVPSMGTACALFAPTEAAPHTYFVIDPTPRQIERGPDAGERDLTTSPARIANGADGARDSKQLDHAILALRYVAGMSQQAVFGTLQGHLLRVVLGCVDLIEPSLARITVLSEACHAFVLGPRRVPGHGKKLCKCRQFRSPPA